MADEYPHTISKDTVLQWVNQYQDATPEFQPGQTLTFEDLEKVRPFLPPGFFDEVAFPIDRLRELADEGVIRSVADFHYSFMGASSPERMRPAVDRLIPLLTKDAVDVVLLVPI